MITKTDEKNNKSKQENLSKEEKIKLIKGKYSFIPTSSDEFANKKAIEIKNEERTK